MADCRSGAVAKVGSKTIARRPPDQLRPPVIHAQLLMIHSVYEIRVTLSTKKFDALGVTGTDVRQRGAVPSGHEPQQP